MKNRYILHIIILFFTILFFVRCEKVIDIDLKDSDPLYVIEGEVNEGDSVHIVKITKSVKFGDLNSFPKVQNAKVTLSDDQGNIELLTEISNGEYVSNQYKIKGVVGQTYNLVVEIEGKTYRATSKIPYKVNLEDILLIDNNFVGNGDKTPVPIRKDPAGIQNNYLFDLYIKRSKANFGWVKDSAVLVLDDVYSDGVLTQQPIFGTIRSFSPKDSIRITMKCIDRNIYKYFYSLSLNGPNGSATPANPISNFSGGALGYFSAQTKQTFQKLVE
jgi:hypothetical protein